MKTSQNFPLMYVLLLICQVILCNFSNLGPFIMLTLLPAMVLCIPTGTGVITCLIVAFASGFAVDWLSEGLLGLNAAALLPVAVSRKWIIRLFLGEDIIARKDSFSIRKNGLGKVSLAIIVATMLFLVIYVTLDGAGTRPFWFCMTRVLISLTFNWLLGLLVVKALTTDDRK